jgi:hypothetical protein
MKLRILSVAFLAALTLPLAVNALPVDGGKKKKKKSGQSCCQNRRNQNHGTENRSNAPRTEQRNRQN